jgi:hypothetical protein
MKMFLGILMFIFSVASQSQAQLSFGGGVHTGISISSFQKTISDAYGIGIGFGGHGDMSLLKFLVLRLNVDYNTFSSSADKLKGSLATYLNSQNWTDPNGNPLVGDRIALDASSISIVGITVNGLGRIPTGSLVTPYGLLGIGIHFMSGNDLKFVSYGGATLTAATQKTMQDDLAKGGYLVDSRTAFGLNFGAGSEFKLGIVKLFFEIKYVLMLTKDNSNGHIPIVVGATIG